MVTDTRMAADTNLPPQMKTKTVQDTRIAVHIQAKLTGLELYTHC